MTFQFRSRRWRPGLGAVLALGVVLFGLATSPERAEAHPHVWITATATVNIEAGAITSVSHVWTFDEAYTEMALDGIAKNKDGGYGRPELAELTQVNVEGLKEFDYFTYASIGKGMPLKLLEPKLDAAWMEYTPAKTLALHFTVFFEKPVPIATKGFNLVVTDPSYFIAFSFDEKNPPKLNADAPKSCKLSLKVPDPEPETDQQGKPNDQSLLAGAFAEQMAQIPISMGGVVQTIVVDCGT